VSVVLVQTQGKLFCKKSGEHYKPCECFPNTSQVYCVGPQVNDDILTTISDILNEDSDKNIRKILISETNIKIIDELFTEIKLEKIFIQNNKFLTQIKPKAFKKGNLKSLTIYNNIILEDNSIFELARNLEPNETIDFGHNKLREMPENAFNSGNMKVLRIYLDNNNITKIGSNAFIGLKSLTNLTISYNSISETEKDSLLFESNTNTNITVLLNNNKLKYDVLNNFKESLKSSANFKLHLENNEISDLPQNIYKDILKSGKVELFFNNNNFLCKNCTLSWLLEEEFAKKYSDKIHSVFCSDGETKQPLFQMDKKDMCHQI